MKSGRMVSILVGWLAAGVVSMCAAGEPTDRVLPAPRTDGGKPLMQALKNRQSTRAFSARALPEQVLADLLWAAFGINRPDTGKRTAPSALNLQEVDIYAITEQGAYLYDAKMNSLKPVAQGDLRPLAGTQDYARTAPLTLVYVADKAKLLEIPAEHQALLIGADVGSISENVYLFCASEGLATVVRGSVDRVALAQALNLPEHKTIVLAQSVGYPAIE